MSTSHLVQLAAGVLSACEGIASRGFTSLQRRPPGPGHGIGETTRLQVLSAAVAAVWVVFGQSGPGETGAARGAERAAPSDSSPEPPEVNLAVVARASASYVSGDTTLAALSDGHQPQSSRDRTHGSYGNWPRRGVEWVQYEWSRPVSTRKIDVYWWDDNRGVRLPKACRLLYWDGQGFQPVKNPTGLGVEGDRFNTTTFDEVRTSRLRLEIESNENFSTGILEWRVYDSGDSPAFEPRVEAGVDRLVVVGAKTYLSGQVKTLGNRPDSVSTSWSKLSGPGPVRFADAASLETTATFSQLGDYVLRLSAEQAGLGGSDVLSVRVVNAPPPQRLEVVPTEPWRIDSPLLSSRLKSLIVNWIPHCIAKISDPQLPHGGINNFEDAARKLAGEPHGPHRGYVFSNAWVFNTIEAMCLALMVDPQGDREIIQAQQAMRETLEDWIPKILAAQEPDGYLQTAFTLNDWEHWSPERRGAHEGYVAGYLLEAAIAHHTLTEGNDLRLYRAARKLADCWCANIGPPPKKSWFDGHQGMELALVRFGRFVDRVEGAGAGRKYIALARFLLDCRQGGHPYDQSHLPVVQQYEAVGHAVRATYNYTAMAQVAGERHDADWLSATMSLWNSIVNRKYYVTGGVGSGETSEGFGPDYSLPHNGYCESCSSCGEVYFQHELHLIHHQARYADLYEETLYNALLGAVDLEGKNFYYQNPLDTRRPRYEWHVCPCCVGNIPRTLLRLPTWTYSKMGEGIAGGIYVNLFVGSTVTIHDVAGTDVEMVQQTDYPWSGKVTIIVNPATAKRFGIAVRVPNRSVSDLYTGEPAADGIESFALNGTELSPEMSCGYAMITREWKRGDRIELELPLKVQRIKAIRQVAATRGQVALRYGPLAYCFEDVDQGLGGVLAPNSPLTTQWQADLLGGVVAIRGAWADGAPLLAIPYYARNNRALTVVDESGNAQAARPARSVVWVSDGTGEQ